MRKVIFVLGLLFYSSVIVCAQKYAIIKGAVEDQWLSQVNLFKTIDGRLEVYATSNVASDGSFGFLIKPEESGFYSLGQDDRMNFPVYIEEGDEVNIVLRENKASLVAKNTKENIQLYKWLDYAYDIWFSSVFFDKIPPTYTYENFFLDFEKFLAGLADLKANLKSGNNSFDSLLKEWIDYCVDYYAINFLYTPRHKHPQHSDWPEFYNSIIRSDKFTNEKVLSFPNGVRILSSYADFASHTQSEENANGQSRAQIALKVLQNDRLRGEYVINSLAPGWRTYEQYLSCMEMYGKYLIAPSLKTRAEVIGTKLYETREGGIAADFTYPDMNGKKVSLSDFKGKVVLIDVWATWCGPCKYQIPYLKRLEEEMRDSDVVFLGVFLDEGKDKQKWLDFIKKEQLGGVQLHAEGWGKITKDYKIKGIPHFIVVDRKGNIVSTDAPRPSQPELKAILEAELKK